MKKLENSKGRMWIAALLLSALAAGCGGGGEGRDPILGGGAGALISPPVASIIPGACTVTPGPTVPMVTMTDPTNGNQFATSSTSGVAGGGKLVTATFSLPMDATTINATTFTLAPAGGAALVPASVSYNVATKTTTYTTSSALLAGTSYTAVIKGAITSATGTAIGCDYVWNFKTATPAAAGLPPVNLGSASTFGIMATAAITNTGNSVINGDVSLDPGTSMTGFGPGVVNGAIHINDTESAQARADLLVGYNDAKGLPPGTTVAGGADLGALYPLGIPPGTYTSGSTMLVSTPLVLDAGGDVNAVWVFQIGSSLTTGASVTMTNGAQAKNVFWVPTSDATIGVGSTFHGTILAGRDANGMTGATINGRILAGAITAGTIALQNNTVNVPAP